MKRIFLAALILLSVSAMAQTATNYADLVVTRPAFKNYNAQLHANGKSSRAETLIRDNSGNVMKFPDEAAALNYVAQQNWEVVSAWYNHHEDATHFLLKKSR